MTESEEKGKKTKFNQQNLQQAMERFSSAMQEFVKQLVEQAKEFQRQEQSRIIVPGGTGTGESGLILK